MERPIPAVVQQAETDQQIIERALGALSSCNWTIGECASLWVRRFSQDRTDEDFGAQVGLSGEQVRQRRAVWERFGVSYTGWKQLRWSHFRAALSWTDAEAVLDWANEHCATVLEMTAWRRAQRGEDLSQPESSTVDTIASEDTPVREAETIRAPVRASGNDRAGCGGEAESPAARAADPASPAGTKKRARSLFEQDDAPAPEPPQAPESPVDEPEPLTVDSVVMQLRTLLRAAQETLEPDEVLQVADELRGWTKKLAPAAVIEKNKPAAAFTPPTVEEVEAYCQERRESGKANNIDAEHWHDSYAAKNWMIGKQKMKDWRAALRRAESEGWADKKTGLARVNGHGAPVSIAEQRSQERKQQMERLSARFRAQGGGE